MKLEITSNINFCLENPIPNFVKYKVFGDWQLNYSTNSITWKREDVYLGTLNGDTFYKLCESLRGSEYENTINILRSGNINIKDKIYTIQELDIIKAIANIFLWSQYFLINDNDIDNEFLPQLYDDFTIDINDKPTTQKDIYFLPKKYSDKKYVNLIDNLMKINLLSRFEISSENTTIINHFIPLTKPGFKQNVFQNIDTYNFWKIILIDRHNAFNKFFNQR